MKLIFWCVALLMVCSTAYGEGNSWNRVRYNGGTLPAKADANDWGNRLTVTGDVITVQLRNGEAFQIPTESVSELGYGQVAHRRFGWVVPLRFMVAPLALFGLSHNTRLHFIGIQYSRPDGQPAGVLLQGDKGNYRDILVALKDATKATLAVAAEDLKYVPPEIEATVVSHTGAEPRDPAPELATVLVEHILREPSPERTQIFVDNEFVGNAPLSLKVKAGKHVFKIASAGHKDWIREITVTSGSEVKLAPVLERL